MSEYEDATRLFAADFSNIQNAIRGYGVISGCSVSALGGTYISWSEGYYRSEHRARAKLDEGVLNLASAQDSSFPRKVFIFVDDTDGEVKIATGTAESAYPVGSYGRKTKRPVPPDFSGDYSIVYGDILLSEIWLLRADSTISSEYVSDRRIIIPSRFNWLEVPPLESPGTQSTGSAWIYTVSEGKRFRLDAINSTWELNGVTGSRRGYFDITTTDGTLWRCPMSGSWSDHTNAVHFSYAMFPGAPESDSSGNQTDHIRPLPYDFELPAGAVMTFHMAGTTSTDYQIVSWIAREVDA